MHTSLIHLSRDECQVGIVDGESVDYFEVPAPSMPQDESGGLAVGTDSWGERVAAIAEFCDGRGAALDEVVLSLSSEICFCGLISIDDLQRQPRLTRARREALLYELEEQVPAAAEDMAADYLSHADGWFAVATSLEPLRKVIAALESRGVSVAAVCPLPFLTLGENLPSTDILLMGEAGHVNLFRLRHGTLVGWLLLPDRAEDVLSWLDMLTAHEADPRPLHAWSVEPTLIEALRDSRPSEVVDLGHSAGLATDLAIRRADEIVRGQAAPFLNLRQDPRLNAGRVAWLQSSLQMLSVAAVICLLSSIAVIWYGIRQYDQQADYYSQRQQEVFERVLPDSVAPLRVARRLESELAILRSGQPTGEAAATRESPSALHTLARIFERLPDTAEGDDSNSFRLHRILANGDELRLEGQAESHVVAGDLASTLGSDDTLRIQSPQTLALSSGAVGFVLTGRDQSVRRSGEDQP